MRIIKKLFLAVLAVSAVGLVGFAGDVKAAPLTLEVDGDIVTGTFDVPEYPGKDVKKYEVDEYDDPVYTVKVDNKKIGEFHYDDDKYDFIAGEDGFSFDIIQMIMGEKGSSLEEKSFTGKISVSVTNVNVTGCYYDEDYGEYDWNDESELKTIDSNSKWMSRGIFKQTVAKTGPGSVRATYDGKDYHDGESFYAIEGDTIDFSVTTDNSDFEGWSGGKVTDNKATVSGVTVYTAKFKAYATGVKISANTTSLRVGKRIKFSASILPDADAKYDTSKKIRYNCAEFDKYFKKISDNEWEAKTATPEGKKLIISATITLTDGTDITSSNTVEVTIGEREYVPCEGFSIKTDETYVTDGYGINLLPDFTKMGTLYNGINWSVEGEGTLTGLTNFTQTGKKSVSDLYGVELKATEGKVEAGKTGTLKVTATIPKGKSTTEDAVATIEITVYPKGTISRSESEKSLSYTAPEKVNTGNTDGVDGENKDVTRTKISEVKGIKIHVLNSDNKFLGMTAIAKDKGKSGTIDSATVGKITGGVSSSLSGDAADIKIKAFPCDSDGKYNKKVYATTSFTVYRVVITYTKADGTTADYITYRPEGTKFNAADAIAEVTATADGKVTQIDGTNDTTITVSTSAAQNKHTAVLGVNRANAASGGGANASARADDSALDKVPKTGQDNTFVFAMVAIVVCAVGGGLYVYNKKAKRA